MSFKLPQDSLALLEKNGVTAEDFLAWVMAKYKFTYKATGLTFCAVLEFFFTYACWEFSHDPGAPRSLVVLFWLALNLGILLPIAIGTGLLGGQRKKLATKEPLIEGLFLSYVLDYSDPKKLSRFSSERWEKIRSFVTTRDLQSSVGSNPSA